MERKVIITGDGSHSIELPVLGETYHSHHGAIQESMHVFIREGLLPLIPSNTTRPFHILEIGFGTGLNALLSYIEIEKINQPVYYTALEPFALHSEEASLLNYCSQLQRPDLQAFFNQLHGAEWERDVQLSSFFTLHKSSSSLLDYASNTTIDLIYFDAFSPTTQPELWSEPVFNNLFSMMIPGGTLVTYCSKSVVRNAMKAAGWSVKKIQGPYGKREMVKAVKSF